MRARRTIATVSTAALAFWLASAPTIALAQTSVDRAFDPAPQDCTEVKWSQAALRSFPSIAQSCRSIEQRNGKTYVKLEGTVESVSDGGKRIEVDFKDGNDLTLTPTPNTRLYIDGERTAFKDLKDGTNLNFYIPEDRLQAELQPDPARTAFIVVPIALYSVPVASASDNSAQGTADLPKTASPWPSLGLAGAVLILAAAILRAVRVRTEDRRRRAG